ncbi:CHAT domain-containing tetratricopeptide repeat protein [Streptomyces sp. NBC_01538]|uniref:CHAT domain-containing tetratricopeptide repeat protein n=1 Tax=Streptomyces sp. NBC_01538 TaxID=2903897 RepID=UPI00386A966E
MPKNHSLTYDAADEPEDLNRLNEVLRDPSLASTGRGRELVLFAVELIYNNRSLEAASQALTAAANLLRKFPEMHMHICLLMGEVASRRSQFKLSRRFTKKALWLAKISRNRQTEAKAYVQLSEIFYKAERIKKSRRQAYRALNITRRIQDTWMEGYIYRLLGEQHFNNGDMGQARKHGERSLEYAATSGDPEALSNCYHLLGQVSYAEDDLDRAQYYAQKSLECGQKSKGRWPEAKARQLLGRVAFWRGDVDESQRNAEQSLAHAISARDLNMEAAAYELLGELARMRRNFQQAKQFGEKALCCSQRSRDEDGQASAHQLLADLARRQGDMEGALQHAAYSLNLSRRTQDIRRQSYAHRLLGDFAFLRRDFSEMTNHAEAALRLAKAAGDRVGEANAETLLVRGLIEQDNYVDARGHVERALGLAEAAEDLPGVASAHMMLALTLACLGPENRKQALREALQAVAGRERIRASMGSAAAERARYLAETQQWDTVPLQLAAELDDGWAGFELMELGRSEALADLLHRYAHGERDLPEEVRFLMTELDTLEAVAAETVDLQTHAHNKALQEKIKQLHTKIAERVGNAFEQVYAGEVIAPQELRDRIPAGVHGLLLRSVPLGDSLGRILYSIWVTPDHDRPPVIEQHVLSEEEVGWLTALSDRRRGHSRGRRLLMDDGHPWRRELSKKLIPADLYALLRGINDQDIEGLPTLLVAPTGDLWGIPFATLDISGRYLIDCAALALLPSMRLLTAPAHSSVSGGDAHEALVYTAEVASEPELEQLTRAYGDRLEVARDAEEVLDALRSGDRYALGVLSVHGNSEPGLAQSLQLSRIPRRRLSAAQMLGLRLPVHLVLGACWSGRLSPVPGEEPLGLPTVALTRGATTLTTALYPVPDEATGMILAEYYKQLASNVHPAQALRASQRRYIANASHALDPVTAEAPWYWAGLTVLTTVPQ